MGDLNKIYKKSGISRSKKIEQYDLNNNLINTWFLLMDIHRKLNYSCGNISLCCNGKKKTYNNYIWKFVNDPNLFNEIWKLIFDDILTFIVYKLFSIVIIF